MTGRFSKARLVQTPEWAQCLTRISCSLHHSSIFRKTLQPNLRHHYDTSQPTQLSSNLDSQHKGTQLSLHNFHQTMQKAQTNPETISQKPSNSPKKQNVHYVEPDDQFRSSYEAPRGRGSQKRYLSTTCALSHSPDWALKCDNPNRFPQDAVKTRFIRKEMDGATEKRLNQWRSQNWWQYFSTSVRWPHATCEVPSIIFSKEIQFPL